MGPSVQSGDADPYLWLEEVTSGRALKWVEDHNTPTLDKLRNDARFSPVRAQIHEILVAKDKLHLPTQRGGYLYNFLQDATHVRGIIRRTTPQGYLEDEVIWETVLDIDALATAENENWVYKGSVCHPEGELCMLALSRGGTDAAVYREFDMSTKAFVKEGFQLAEAKSSVEWAGKDELLVATDYGAGSLTLSGYPRIFKRWKRGTPLSEAATLFEAEVKDVNVGASHFDRDGLTFTVVSQSLSFFETAYHLVKDGKTTRLDFPTGTELITLFRGQVVFSLREEWDTPAGNFKAGTLLATPLESVELNNPSRGVQVLFEPQERVSLAEVHETSNGLVLSIMDNVLSTLEFVRFVKGKVQKEKIPLSDVNGALTVVSSSDKESRFYVKAESFLQPASLIVVGFGEKGRGNFRVAKQLPARFDSSPFLMEQLEATSKDGVSIPYFVIRRADVPFDGSTPTLLYGYGGFEVSMTPYYLEGVGRAWLEKGGAYVLANIRGGGEFGPKWHEAALKQNRQKAYDDFIAIAEALIESKLTSPSKLGIQGGSNGGLLMGAMFTQRPELFKAVICQVPLLDMLRYHKLLAGNSWMGEYGNPDIAEEAAYIRKYSPYQNIVPEKKYPKVFFMTSTKDDRVHPGHARKAAARLEEYGNDVLYYENTEGGHGGAANLEQRATFSALGYTYLYQQLFD